jgi:hypothetical protein
MTAYDRCDPAAAGPDVWIEQKSTKVTKDFGIGSGRG